MNIIRHPLCTPLVGLLACLAACSSRVPVGPVVVLQEARAGTDVNLERNGNVWIADVRCPSGIGWASFRLSDAARPGRVIFRLHLRGLEGASLEHNGLKTEFSVSSHGDLTIREWTGNEQPPKSQDRIPVSLVTSDGNAPRIPLDGWFEIQLPESCSGNCTVKLNWIDFYR